MQRKGWQTCIDWALRAVVVDRSSHSDMVYLCVYEALGGEVTDEDAQVIAAATAFGRVQLAEAADADERVYTSHYCVRWAEEAIWAYGAQDIDVAHRLRSCRVGVAELNSLLKQYERDLPAGFANRIRTLGPY